MAYRLLAVLLVLIFAACAQSPLGRTQLMLFPGEQLDEMGAIAFQEVKQETPRSDDPAVISYVECVATHITDVLEEGPEQWEVAVFAVDQANAFALPGGRIGVFTGLLDITGNQEQLATIIGHEVAHVLAEHSNERLSTAYAAEAGLQVIQSLRSGPTGERDTVMGLLGLGAQFGILLPFNRAQEREADVLGLRIMARAGFDPRESIGLWENMLAAGAAEPPEFLSTHPTHGTRIEVLTEAMPEALEIWQEARAAGRAPACD